MEFSFHTTYNSTQQQHVQKHYPCISRPLKFYLKIGSQKLDLYTSIYGKCIFVFYSGIVRYKFAVSIFRRMIRMWFVNPELEILSLRIHDDQSAIEVRWRISGWTRFNTLATLIFQLPANQRLVGL